MKRNPVVLTASVLMLSLTMGGVAHAGSSCGSRRAVVSGSWLHAHRQSADLVVVDIRTTEEYAAGHIPGSVNIPLEIPLSAWTAMRGDLLLELPEASELFNVFGSFGIMRHMRIVIVGSVGQPPYPQANAARAAATLMYAGASHVSILDGGYPKWVSDGMEVTTAVPVVTPTVFSGVVRNSLFVDADDVSAGIGRSLIIDARDAEVYSGQVTEPWAGKAGHIPSAVSLPSTLIWNADGTYRSRRELMDLVAGVARGRSRDAEIIVYCGVGGYASAWLYVLTEMLGYRNVKMYDGSAQDWVKCHDMEM